MANTLIRHSKEVLARRYLMERTHSGEPDAVRVYGNQINYTDKMCIILSFFIIKSILYILFHVLGACWKILVRYYVDATKLKPTAPTYRAKS